MPVFVRRKPTQVSRSRFDFHVRRSSHPRKVRRGSSSSAIAPSKKLTAFITFFVLFVVGSGVCFAFLREVAPQLFGLKQNTQIVFVSNEKDGRNKKIYYAMFLADQRTLHWWELPSEQLVNVIGGYGQYPLGAVQPLLRLEKKSAQFEVAAFSHAVGVTVPTVLSVAEPTDHQLAAGYLGQWWLAELTQNPVKAWRLLQWYWTVSRLEKERVVQHGAVSGAELQKTVSQLPDWFDSDCSVAVVNTTSIRGLATQVDLVLEASQLKVIKVTDTNQQQEQSQVAILEENPACERAIRTVQSALPQQVPVAVHPSLANQYRADVVVLLGKDIENVFTNH